MSDWEYAKALIQDMRMDFDELTKAFGELHEQRDAKVIRIQPAPSNKPKLNKREVTAIRTMSRYGHSNRYIADIYEVNPATVSRIVRGIYHH